MIVDERFVTYINSLDTENTSFLEELEKTAKEAYVPIIRREMQSLLKLLLAMKRPIRILEDMRDQCEAGSEEWKRIDYFWKYIRMILILSMEKLAMNPAKETVRP